jgi:DNA polymerase I-like protein with 3'-5' exonuclease and polymerase domains
MVPVNATKQSHPKERSIFKVVFLANSYGMGPRMLAKKLKISIGEAKALMIKFKKIYSVYSEDS